MWAHNLVEIAMNLDAEKWGLLEKADDYRFLLRLLAFALVADLVLQLGTGAGLIQISVSQIAAQPGIVLLVAIAYSATVTLGAGLCHVAVRIPVGLLVLTIEGWLGRSPARINPDPSRFIALSQARDMLADRPDADLRARVEARAAERRKEVDRWHSVVCLGWVCVLLVGLSWWASAGTVWTLIQWNVWSVAPFILVAGLPCLFDLFHGAPENDFIELPELAKRVQRDRARALGSLETTSLPRDR